MAVVYLVALLYLVLCNGVATSITPKIFYGPRQPNLQHTTRSDLFTLLNAPDTAWPKLANKTSYLKLFLSMVACTPSAGCPTPTTDNQLLGLIAALKAHGIKTGIEIGGARWGNGRCDAKEMLEYAALEQEQVNRWIQLGGSIDSVSTDHADVWDVRGLASKYPCVPAVPMRKRIDVVAQVFASWRKFLGPEASLGFIESLGFWEIEGPDGTNFTNTDPLQLNNISGWIPRLDDVTALLLADAKKYNPMPDTPLINHYQIDYGMGGVEYDTLKYGRVPPSGINYGRVLGAEAIMHKHGLQTGIILNAFRGNRRPDQCIVECNPANNPKSLSHSAAIRTINYTRGYMQQVGRLSDHAVLEQWQDYPASTGPEGAVDTSMWMASQCADIIRPT